MKDVLVNYYTNINHNAISRGMRYQNADEEKKRVKNVFKGISAQNEFMHRLHDCGKRFTDSVTINGKV